MSTPVVSSPASYRKTLLSYIDILGFRDEIDSTTTNPGEIDNVHQVLQIMKDEMSAGGRTHRGPDGRKQRIFHALNFSDLTVRCTQIPDGENLADYVNWELLYLGEKQLQLLNGNVLLRGGSL